MFEISNDIPHSSDIAKALEKAPWDILEIGESFFVERKYSKFLPSVCKSKSHDLGKEFDFEKEGNGHRVWRIEKRVVKNLKHKIISVIERYPNVTDGIILNKIKSAKKNDVAIIIDELVQNGIVTKTSKVHSKKKIDINFYSLADKSVIV